MLQPRGRKNGYPALAPSVTCTCRVVMDGAEDFWGRCFLVLVLVFLGSWVFVRKAESGSGVELAKTPPTTMLQASTTIHVGR